MSPTLLSKALPIVMATASASALSSTTDPANTAMTLLATTTAPDTPDSPDAAPCPHCGATTTTTTMSTPVTHQDGYEGASAGGPDTAAALAEAHRQIRALEAQVCLLNDKAAAAADRWADYEDELVRLRSGPGGPPTPEPAPEPAARTRTSFLPVGAASRLSALLSPRAARSTPNLKRAASAESGLAGMPQTPTHSHSSTSSSASSTAASSPATTATPTATTSSAQLLAVLTREQTLRRQAEARLRDSSREIEELSVSLFEQANQMVADERRARARLEQRVAELAQRDVDKRQRLARLEQAVERIGRVRVLLAEAEAYRAEPSDDHNDDDAPHGRGHSVLSMHSVHSMHSARSASSQSAHTALTTHMHLHSRDGSASSMA